jgi:predicted SnoaL-like aldol condensation-catalyzing enzyme
MPEHDPVANKQRAIAFYELMFGEGRPREAVERHVGETYTQHNPEVADGTEAFVAYFEEMAEAYPDKEAIVHRAVAEGDLVALHVEQRWPGDDDYAAIDLFRFDGEGRIVEHWDALQPVPDETAHANGMF